MALLTVRQIGDEVLRKVCRDVTKFNDKLKILAEDMIETMHDHNGIGLAASQVGRLRRIIVVDLYDETGPKVFVNPVITSQEGSTLAVEGCLSIPDESGYVQRPQKIDVEAYDLDGNKMNFTAEDLFARVICHEIDHLNGVLFVDKVVEVDEKELEELEREDEKV